MVHCSVLGRTNFQSLQHKYRIQYQVHCFMLLHIRQCRVIHSVVLLYGREYEVNHEAVSSELTPTTLQHKRRENRVEGM